MALSAQLAQAGLTAESIDTVCTITLDKDAAGLALRKATWICTRASRERARKRSTRR